MIDSAPGEMQMLFWAIVLGLVQLTAAALVGVWERGLLWAIGARDVRPEPLGLFAARLERAWLNFLETFPFFAAAVLAAHALGRHTEWSVPGAQLYVVARVLYVPAYVAGIPFVRTLIWLFALLGIVLVAMAIWPG